MIKKLHYCWFGGPVPNAVLANVQRWKALNPEFELIEWNENNIDVSSFEFGRRCLKQKKMGVFRRRRPPSGFNGARRFLFGLRYRIS